MTAPLIESYTASLRRRLPATLAEEAAAGLQETYERHLADGSTQDAAARDAIAEFGQAPLVISEFTRQAPGRRAARLLLATGPAAGSCWAAALITSRAWTWPVPGAARLAFGTILLLTVLALLAAATSHSSYRRTRLSVLACPVILALDATTITAVAAFAPAPTWPLAAALTVSLARIAFTTRTMRRLTAS